MKQDSKPVMSNTVDKHTPGPWEMKAAKWTNDPEEEMGGFSIQAGDKKICGFNVVIDSRILPAQYFTNWPEHHKEHFTVKEAEANAAFIASAPTLKKENEELKERNRVLVEALEGLPFFLNNAADSLEFQANKIGNTNVLTPKLKWYADKIKALQSNK